jgi:hypothetical protein
MPRTAATEVENSKRSLAIAVGKTSSHIAKNIVMVHVVVRQDLIVDRPLVDELPGTFLDKVLLLFVRTALAWRPVRFNQRQSKQRSAITKPLRQWQA